ncbi:MAG: TRAP transporter substrate-binding protein [Betaproteobacteria bacterium]|nr:MAG: TRAP transporter substrate-binding protein [Betaproteobacteria bacterium]TMI04537.1 MAG: TRAP transporter substrate-binding protein [Betaproteobacteria bacterium]TMI06021.1 MAG: TRAP transporter substrate-binding protein [Betaproteobacteria bacterium]
MKRRIPFALAAAALIGSAQAQTKWDMPTPYPDGNFHTKNARQFAEDVAKATAGKLQIQVHSNASLIKHPEIKRAVQTGQVPIGEVLISVLANESPLFAFDSIPFLANSYAKERTLWRAAQPYVEKRLDGQGVKLLYSVPWPPQGIYTKKEIHALSDLKGTKFRTYSPTTSRFAELIGAVPTTVQVPDVPQAFRTGLVDAMLTSGATGVDSQAWDYLQYYYDTQAFLPQNMVIVGKAALGKLDAGEQKAVLGAAKEAEARGWKTSETENEGYVRTMASHGIKIMKPSARLSSEFDAIGKKIADEWAAKAGAEGGAILKAFRK